jgi:hypothetical protein
VDIGILRGAAVKVFLGVMKDSLLNSIEALLANTVASLADSVSIQMERILGLRDHTATTS